MTIIFQQNKSKFIKAIIIGIGCLFIFSTIIFSVNKVLAATAPAESTAGTAATKKDDALYYRPNIYIPGMEKIFTETKQLTDKITQKKYTAYKIDSNALANYIKLVYQYAGIIAGAFAMFMLVYASWQWLMAGGNASKVTMAKETVTTTLIGLAFLFGSYLLLSQISNNLVEFNALNIDKIASVDTCEVYTDDPTCTANNCQWCGPDRCAFREVINGVTQEVPPEGKCFLGPNSSSTGQKCAEEATVQPIIIANNKFAIDRVSATDPRLGPAALTALGLATYDLAEGDMLVLKSAFRSWAKQEKLYQCSLKCTADCNGECNDASEPNCETSSHMKGIAVDVCLISASRGINTCYYEDADKNRYSYIKKQFNCRTQDAYTNFCTPKLREGQDYLKTIMERRESFIGIPSEWWHFQLK